MHRNLKQKNKVQADQRHFQRLLEGPRPFMRWIFTAILFSFVIFAALNFTEEKDFLELIKKTKPFWIFVGILLQAGTYCSQSFVWKQGLEATGQKVRVSQLYKLSVAQLFINQAIPSLSVSGALFVTKALSGRGVPHRNVSVTLGLSLISYSLAYVLAIWSGIVILGFQRRLVLSTAITLSVLLFFVFISILSLSRFLTVGNFRRMKKKLHLNRFSFTRNFFHVFADMDLKNLTVGNITKATALQLTVFIIDFLTLWSMLKALGINAHPGGIYISYMTAYVLRSVGFIPGGVGIFEAAAITSLHYAGVSVAGSLAGTLLYRGLSYWIPMIPGLFLVRREFSHSTRIRASKIENYWSMDMDELYVRLKAFPEGLTTNEAHKRLILNGPNTIHEHHVPVLWEIFWNQIRSPLVLILVAAALISSVLNDWSDAVIILILLLTGIVIGGMRESQAHLILEKLRKELALKTNVLRDGVVNTLPAEVLVPGDIIQLSAGDLIPADVLILESKDCFVNEASITGESFPVLKTSLQGMDFKESNSSERKNALFLGSHVQSGFAKCLVVNTGPVTMFGLLAESVQRAAPLTDFDQNISAFGYMIVKLMLVIVFLVFIAKTYTSGLTIDSLMFSVALAVGLSPELLPLIINYDLAAGAKRLAEKGLLVRHPKAIENLGAVDILCTDKSGTITEGVVNFGGAFDSFGNESRIVLDYAWINATLQAGLINPLDQVLKNQLPTRPWEVVKSGEIPYDFKRKRLSIIICKEETCEVITKGAFEKVLETCSYDQNGENLTDEKKNKLRFLFEQWGRKGERVLGVSVRELSKDQVNQRALESQMRFLGFLLFHDSPREHAIEVLEDLKNLGIRIKIITGDNSIVTKAIAEKVGLDPSKLLEGKDLDEISNEALPILAQDIELFTQVDPHQKERIITAYRKLGHTVAYMGDGINDVSAMHASDASISVASAADVTKSTADVVLLEKSLEYVKTGIKEGRTTFHNSLKYINITMSANLGNMISMAIASMFLPFLPLLAGQILLNNLLSDIPAFGLAQDNVDPEILRRPTKWNLKSILKFMIIFGLISTFFDLLTFYLLLAKFQTSVMEFRTAWFTESLLTELFIVMVLRTQRPILKSRPSKKLLVLTLSMAVLTMGLSYLPWVSVLGFRPMRIQVMMAIVFVTIGYLVITEITKRAVTRGRMREN